MNSTLRLNSASRQFAGETARELSHPQSWPSLPGSSPETHDLEHSVHAGSRDVDGLGLGFTGRGIPLSPLHDV